MQTLVVDSWRHNIKVLIDNKQTNRIELTDYL
jgi:hypothetical protein